MPNDRLFCTLRLRGRFATWFMIVLGVLLVILSLNGWVGIGKANPETAVFTAPLLQGAANGAALFAEKCTGCHTIGGGKLIGPDLMDVTTQRDPDWLRNFIADPAKMIASDPSAQALFKEYNNFTMPNLGLTQEEITDLITYLANPGAVPAAPAAPIGGAGDPAAGQRLFTGGVALTNGGAPCIACHAVTGVGVLGGGSLGPNLTHVIQRLGEPGVAAALKTIAFPTMLEPYRNRPFTPQEQADLVAFLKNADLWQAPVTGTNPGALTQYTILYFGIALAVAAVLFGLLLLFWLRSKQRSVKFLPERNPLMNKRRPS